MTNPLFLFLAAWGAATLFYALGVLGGISSRGLGMVLGAVLLNVTAFTLGYLTWNTVCAMRPTTLRVAPGPGVPLTAGRMKWSLRITLAFGLVAFGLCMARLVAIASYNSLAPIHLLTDPLLWRRKLVQFVGEGLYETRLSSIAISVSYSLFSVGFVFLGIWMYMGRRRSRYVYLAAFLLLGLAMGMLNLSRKEVVVHLLFVILAYLFMHRLYGFRDMRQVARSLLGPFLIGVLLFVLVDVFLKKSLDYGIGGRLAGSFFSLYWYIASPLAALGEFLANHQGDYLMGQSLFLPIYKWLDRFDLVPPTTMVFFSEKVYVPYMANVFSYLRTIYEDFGMLGIAIFPYALGWIASVMQRRAATFLPYLNIYLVLLVLIIFSFYNYLFVSNQFYLQMALPLVLFRFRLTDLDPDSL
jgi:oligosaccharide repeat unit polymerase